MTFIISTCSFAHSITKESRLNIKAETVKSVDLFF